MTNTQQHDTAADDGEDVDSAGAHPPEPLRARAQRELTDRWLSAKAELIAKRKQRDDLAVEIAQLVNDEDILRQAVSVFDKRKGKS